MRKNPSMSGYAIKLEGGRYDGATIPCPESAFTLAIVFLIQESAEWIGPRICTLDGFEAHFYYPNDFQNTGNADLKELDDPTVYHRCTDHLWRPLKLKSALGL